MKILLVSHFFPPDHNTGAVIRTLGYALALKNRNHDVQVLCAGRWGEGRSYWNGILDDEYMGVSVRRLCFNWTRAPDPNLYLYDNPVVERFLDEWIEELQPDIVHIVSCLSLSASVIRAVRAHGLPLVIHLVDFWFLCPRVTLVRKDGTMCDGQTSALECLRCNLYGTKAQALVEGLLSDRLASHFQTWVSKHPFISKRPGLCGMAFDMEHRKSLLPIMLNLANHVIAPSSHLRVVYESCGVKKPIEVVHSGHDLNWLSNYRGKSPSSKLRFGYIGQISSTKGVDLLISAYNLAGLDGLASLSIYGDLNQYPDFSKKLLETAKEYPNIRFKGRFPHEQLAEVLAEIDVLVVPSQWSENNPRVIQEAFSTKTPVIATDVGGISEFVQHGVNGLLFGLGDVSGLSILMRRIVSEPGLLDHLRMLIPKVKSMVEEIDRLEDIYEEYIG